MNRPVSREQSKSEVSNTVKWQRGLLGGSAVVLLVAGLAMSIWPTQSANSSEYFSGTLIKVGVVLGVAWLAAPQLERLGWQRLRGSLLIGLILVLVLWAIRPRIGAWAAAIFIGGSLFFALIGWFRSLFDPAPPRTK